MMKKELLDFLYWQDENYDYLGYSNEEIVDYYLKLKSNNSAQGEISSVSSHKDKKEFCPNCESDEVYISYHWKQSHCKNCKHTWSWAK